MTRRYPALATAVLVLLLAGAATAFEPATTHPGMTGKALLASKLHTFLKRDCGWDRGLFHELRLDADSLSRRDFSVLVRDLRRMDPSGGFAPDDRQRLRAAGWAMAGSVMAQLPASTNRHHFYCPPLRRGLDDTAPVLGTFLGFLAMLEGGDTVRQFFTGTGFDLTGQAATEWIKHAHNRWSVSLVYDSLARSVAAAAPRQREHHLAMALMALGGVLHVLQDMASPTHVRDDFRAGHLARLGATSLNRGSAFERYVARRYGQFGVPGPGKREIRRKRLVDYFSNADWDGLADITHVQHLSPGTLPPSVVLVEGTDAGELRRRLNERLPFARPALGPIDLGCLRRHSRCYLDAGSRPGPLAAYRVTSDRRLELFLDEQCHAAAARHLLPLAVAFSAGLVDHVVRARVTLTRDDGKLVVTNAGVAIKRGKARLLAEDAKGVRSVVRQIPLTLPAAKGGALARLVVEPPAGARALHVLIEGEGEYGDRLVATARVDL